MGIESNVTNSSINFRNYNNNFTNHNNHILSSSNTPTQIKNFTTLESNKQITSEFDLSQFTEIKTDTTDFLKDTLLDTLDFVYDNGSAAYKWLGDKVDEINNFCNKTGAKIVNGFNTMTKQLSNLKKSIEENINEAMDNISQGFSNGINSFKKEEKTDKAIKDLYGSVDYSNIEDDGYKPQGFAKKGDLIFISAYQKDELSRVYIYNSETGEYEGKITLNNKAHVGGMGFDEKNNILYITNSKGRVNAYNYSEIEKYFSLYKEKFPDKECNLIIANPKESETSDSSLIPTSVILDGTLSVKDNTEKGAASTLYYHDGRVYIGTFDGVNKGQMISYKVSYDSEENQIVIDENATIKYDIPKNTQGIAVTEHNGKQYLVTTQSIGIANSSITVFEIKDDGSTKEIGIKYYDDKGLEGIDIDENGNILGVFENGRNNTLVTNMDDLLDSLGIHNMIYDATSDIGGWIYENL